MLDPIAGLSADGLIDRLISWRLNNFFGLPGDGINGIFEALGKKKDRIRFIHTGYEKSGPHLTCVCASFIGRSCICVATSGPGSFHLLWAFMTQRWITLRLWRSQAADASRRMAEEDGIPRPLAETAHSGSAAVAL